MTMTVTTAIAEGLGCSASPAADASPSPPQRRWQIIELQLRAGHEPCVGTEKRYTCAERDCGFRTECVVMRASWRG